MLVTLKCIINIFRLQDTILGRNIDIESLNATVKNYYLEGWQKYRFVNFRIVNWFSVTTKLIHFLETLLQATF